MCDLEAKQEFQFSRKLNNLTSYYYDTTFNRFYYITIDDIRSKYLPLGFNQFKISGRSEEKISVFLQKRNKEGTVCFAKIAEIN